MTRTFEKYISENDIIKIRLIKNNSSVIFGDTIFLYNLSSDDDIFKKIIISGKQISIEFNHIFNSNILPYTNEILLLNGLIKENIINIFDQCINLQKIIINSLYISNINVCDKLCEKKLKFIQIILTTDIDLDYIYQIIKIKSLDTLCLSENLYGIDNLGLEKKLKILYFILNNLKKNIQIIMINYVDKIKLEKYLSLVTYNFKVDKSNYIFTYIPPTFRKFDNLYDFYLCYD